MLRELQHLNDAKKRKLIKWEFILYLLFIDLWFSLSHWDSICAGKRCGYAYYETVRGSLKLNVVLTL